MNLKHRVTCARIPAPKKKTGETKTGQNGKERKNDAPEEKK
jgi:hypothetical protein